MLRFISRPPEARFRDGCATAYVRAGGVPAADTSAA